MLVANALHMLWEFLVRCLSPLAHACRSVFGADTELAKARTALAARQDEAAQVHRELHVSRSECASLAESLKDTSARLASAELSAQRTRAMYDRERVALAALREEAVQLQHKLSELRGERDSFATQLASVEHDFQQAVKERDGARQQLGDAQCELEKRNGQLDKWALMFEEVQTAAESAAAMKVEAERASNGWREQLRAAEAQLRAVANPLDAGVGVACVLKVDGSRLSIVSSDVDSGDDALVVVCSDRAGWVDRSVSLATVTRVDVVTVCGGARRRYECVLTLEPPSVSGGGSKVERLTIASSGAQAILRLVRDLWPVGCVGVSLNARPLWCMLAMRDRRKVYVTGHASPDIQRVSLTRDLAARLRELHNVELLYEPDPQQQQQQLQPYLLLFLYIQSPSRIPQRQDIETWTASGHQRSAGNCVWLVVIPWQYANGVPTMDSSLLPSSGIHMLEPARRIPSVLSIGTTQSDDAYPDTALDPLVARIALLLDQMNE